MYGTSNRATSICRSLAPDESVAGICASNLRSSGNGKEIDGLDGMNYFRMVHFFF